MKNDLYVGFNLANIEPMNRGEYCKLKGWKTPITEMYSDQGYRVRNVFTWFEIWLSENEFNFLYKPVYNMVSFSVALEALKQGYRIYRKGWNGKDQFIQLEPSTVSNKPDIMVICNQDNMWCPWVPSMTDALKEDWIIGERVELRR